MDSKFSAFLDEKYPQQKRNTSGVIHKSFGQKIIECLKNPASADKNLRFYVKKGKFQLLDIPSLGIKEPVLVVPAPPDQIVKDSSILASVRRVAFVEEFEEIVCEAHDSTLHAGYKKTFDKIQSMYRYLPRSVVQEYIKKCSTCQLRKPQSIKTALKPIISKGFLQRLQIDLIDMRHLPDGQYKWIFHGVDHWSKFNFVYPIERKSALCVSNVLESHVFPYFGVPRILQSDNGREFINSVIEQLLRTWGNKTQMISGRPRHPQSQGAVERAHSTLQRKLQAEIYRVGTKKT